LKLTFINHACCKLIAGEVGLLFDPWIEGPVFNDGWDLLIPTPLSLDAIMAGVTHIWLSHEHPDHFSPGFLSRIVATHKDRVTILFQPTRDHRVAEFCRGLGFRVIEMQNRAPRPLGAGVTATCGTHDFYDSWLHVSDGKQSLLNVNDCQLGEAADLARLYRLFGSPTVILSQFSYAAWKGGKTDRAYREAAAAKKRDTLTAQVRALHPAFAVPIASMIYFSSVENAYLNDAMNTPRVAADTLAAAGTLPVVLYPGDEWEIGAAHDNAEAMARYARRYAELAQLPLRGPGASASIEELKAAFVTYQARVFARNSRLLIALVSKLSFLGAFQPLTIRLSDLGRVVSYSLFDGIAVLSAARDADVTMHSSSLLFLLRNEFGYDTLTVNGRFEATPQGFAKMTRALGIGSLNAMGLSISPGLAFNSRALRVLLLRQRQVMRALKSRDVARQGA
jgi:UDP-MurNAc hydroxylase